MTLFLAVPLKIKLKPANLTVAQWSLQFCLATTIVDGHLLHPVGQLSRERLEDTKILELAQRIKGVLSEQLDRLVEEQHILQSPFRLKLKDGKVLEGEVSCKGFPDNPLTQSEIDSKFSILVSRVLGKERAENLYSLLAKVEEMEDMTPLVRAMCQT